MNTTTQHTTQYKNSPLGLIPEDWEVKSIGKITKTTAGGTPSTHKLEYWNGDIKWMSSGDLNLKRIYDVEGRITEIGLKNSSTKLIPSNCVLIGLAGQGKTRGTVAMNMVELCTNQSVAAILPSKVFYEEYLYHNLDYRYSELRQLSTGDGGRGGLNLNIINSILVPIPSKNEQKAIADCLSTWDKAIEKQNALIAQKELAKKALMQQLLSGKKRLKGFSGKWNEVRLGEIFSLSSGDTKPVTTDRIKSDVLKFPVYGGNGIMAYSKDYNYEGKTILIGRVGEYCGVTSCIEGKFWITDNALYISKILISCSIDFLTYKLIYEDLSKLRNKGGQPLVSQKPIYSKKIKLPSQEEQTSIAKVLQCADAELQLLKKKLEQLKEQKKGLMQVLLTGKKRLEY